MIDISQTLPDLWPNCPAELMGGLLGTYAQVFDKYEINSRLRVLHLLTQISAESDGGRISHESLFYTHAERLRAVWPSRFRDKDDEELESLLRNPTALADAVYEGRMGNINPGDGGKYLGRGLIQTTGRDSYAWLEQVTGIPLIDNPDLICDPKYTLECATAEFVNYSKCLPYADQDDLLAVSGLINVGRSSVHPSQVVGWDNRQDWYQRWDNALPS